MGGEKQTGICWKRAGAIARLGALACGALLLAGLGGVVSHGQTPPTGEWTWIAGSSTEGSGQGQSGVYGTLLTPATGNIPGGRNSASTWTDSKGNLWLFGGFGYASNATFGYLNDLWEFNPSTKEWAWMGGSNTLSGDYGSASGDYGKLLTPAAANVPGGRQSASSWVDKNGNLWLFGGQGEGAGANCAGGAFGDLNDMWEFNPAASESSTNQWAWMAGGCTANASGMYPGRAGAPAASGLTPGGRYAAASWTGSNGNFWLFGGEGYDANGNFGDLNDLWEFNPSTKLWAWMGGSSTIPAYSGQPGVYGMQGEFAAGNIPGGRYGAFSWTDSSGNFWLYGGDGYDALGNFVYLNDLWEFNPSTKQWAWVGGSSALTSYYGAWPAVYGTEGTPAAENLPGGRYEGSGWTDSSGHLWLFGGDGYGASTGFLNDLWEFNSPTSQWVWQSGNGTPFQSGTYGAQTPPASGGTPGSRVQPASWTDASGNLWLFGGSGRDSQGSQGELNDLWEYPPSSVSFGGTAAATPAFSEASGTYSTTQTVSIADAAANATIYYTTTASTSPPTPPTTPTTSSSVYNSSNPISVSATEVLEAIATAPGDSTSAVATAAYTITPQAATPTFSPVAGTYSTTQTVTISDATLGALVFYTTNGTTPTFTGTGPAKSPGPGTTLYTVPIAVSSTETIEALATAYGYSTSAVASALYTIGSPQAATPTFSPAAGTYTSAQTVTIGDTTPNATIYYTTDGSSPTTSSNVYSGPITVSSTETIHAIATASGYSTSAAGTAMYTINLPPPTVTDDETITVTDTETFSDIADAETITVTDTDTVVAVSAIAIAPTSASFNASSFATAAAGQAYGPVTFTATGGTGALTLSESGTLPSGVTFSKGVLSGTLSASSAGMYPFSITATDANQDQTTQTGYTLTVATVPAPTVTGVSPNSGPAAGGTTVTITGSNFTSASTVSFGTTAAMNVSCSSVTSCTATSPPGTSTVDVTVTTPGGTSVKTAADRFTYANPAPVISSLSPAVVSAGGTAFTLTVNGSGFTPSSTVYWGTTALALGTINIGGTRLTAQVTATDIASAGITNVTVQTPAPGGGTSNAFQFEVDSAASGTTTITTVTATVAPGSTASYPVTTPPAASNVTVTCLNLPPGATCSYNSATNSVTIATSATTPAGTYQITVVFTLTEPGSASGFILLPILLLPLVFLRRRLAARGGWATACLGMILLAGAAAACIGGIGCGGPGPTHQGTSSGAVTLTVT